MSPRGHARRKQESPACLPIAAITAPNPHGFLLSQERRGESAPGLDQGADFAIGMGIREGVDCQLDFDEAVRLHRFVDKIREASEQERAAAVV